MTASGPWSFNDGRPTILVLLGGFWPGREAAGPIQSLVALAKALEQDFNFKIIGRDRPFEAREAMAETGVWTNLGNAKIRYCTVSRVAGALGLAEILRTTTYDLIVMNGFFGRDFTIPALLLRRMGRIPRRPAILSTRGEFSDGALAFKSRRKQAYIGLARRLNLLEDVWLHATGPQEAADIGKGYPYSRGTLIAPNIRQLGALPAADAGGETSDQRLRIVFLSRIDRKKNIDYAISVLASLGVPIRFDIFGPVSHADYWMECKRLIETLPPHVNVRYLGTIPNGEVATTLAAYDLFFLPTKGENFGHAIVDALEAGLPVLLSDQTPWTDLDDREAGWSLPLDQPHRFAEAINRVAAMSPDQRARLRAGARRLAEHTVNNSDAIAINRRMFASVIRAGIKADKK